MIYVPTGSVLWLVRHELRIEWRSSALRRPTFIFALALLWAAMHWAAGVALRWGGYPYGSSQEAPRLFGLLLWSVIGVALARATWASVAALWTRGGELQLLLSSPLPTRTICLARALRVAVDSGVFLAFVLAPIVNMALLLGQENVLPIYLALPALALMVAGAGILLSSALISAVGLRRIRGSSKVLGTLVAAGAFAIFQFHLASNRIASAPSFCKTSPATDFKQSIQDAILCLPTQIQIQDPFHLAILWAASSLIFRFAFQRAHRLFIEDDHQYAAPAPPPMPNSVRRQAFNFGSGILAATFRKEFLLFTRDPHLIVQTAASLLYAGAAFLAIAIGDGMKDSLSAFVGAGITYCATMLAGSLAWVSITAEEQPDLLKCAPSRRRSIVSGKVWFALLPTWLVSIPALMLLAWIDATSLPLVLFCMVSSTASEVAGHVWYPTRIKRTMNIKRLIGRGMAGPISICVSVAWAMAVYCWPAHPNLTLASIFAALGGLTCIWALGRSLI